jgi:magnesium chelatase family protein
MWIEVPNVDHHKLSDETQKGEGSKSIKERVLKARKLQEDRFSKMKKDVRTNSRMSSRDIEKHIPLSAEVKAILNASATKLGLSARAYHRIIKLARTIADLETSENIETKHILEALQYRPRKIGA